MNMDFYSQPCKPAVLNVSGTSTLLGETGNASAARHLWDQKHCMRLQTAVRGQGRWEDFSQGAVFATWNSSLRTKPPTTVWSGQPAVSWWVPHNAPGNHCYKLKDMERINFCKGHWRISKCLTLFVWIILRRLLQVELHQHDLIGFEANFLISNILADIL